MALFGETMQLEMNSTNSTLYPAANTTITLLPEVSEDISFSSGIKSSDVVILVSILGLLFVISLAALSIYTARNRREKIIKTREKAEFSIDSKERCSIETSPVQQNVTIRQLPLISLEILENLIEQFLEAQRNCDLLDLRSRLKFSCLEYVRSKDQVLVENFIRFLRRNVETPGDIGTYAKFWMNDLERYFDTELHDDNELLFNSVQVL